MAVAPVQIVYSSEVLKSLNIFTYCLHSKVIDTLEANSILAQCPAVFFPSYKLHLRHLFLFRKMSFI